MNIRLQFIPLLLLILSIALLPVPAAAGDDGPGVDSMALVHAEGTALVRLGFVNSGREPAELRLQLQLLDTSDGVVAVKDAHLLLPPGEHTGTVHLPEVDALDHQDRRRLQWYRLRYRLFDATTGRFLSTGIEGLARMSDDALSLVLTGPEYVLPEHPLHLMVRAQHPVTGDPAAGVDVHLVIEDDMGEADPIVLTVTTDGQGKAWASSRVPLLSSESDLEVTARASRGPFIEELSADIWITDSFPMTVVTDRPIYQPGQTVHYRVLALDAGRQAFAGQALELIIEDEEGATCHRATGVTSEFGLFHGFWQTGVHTPAGECEIEVVAADEAGNDTLYGEQSFLISRYELPTMAVRAETVRPWYLAGEPPEITVAVTTLGGESIRGAAVEILPLDRYSRFINFEDTSEEDRDVLVEGTTDAKGTWSGSIGGDVLTEQAGSYWKKGYCQFRDIGFAARVTDPDSGRTSLCRFEVRLTRQTVHVYLDEWEPGAPGLPMTFRVSTFSPAGDPLSCRLRVSCTGSGGEGEPLLTASTDRLGLAEIELDPPPDCGRRFDLSVQAATGDGSTGSVEEKFWRYEGPLVRLRAGRFRCQTGEAIPVTLSCWPPAAEVWIEADIDGEVLWDRHLDLEDGRQEILVPWDPRFKGEINVRAFLEGVEFDEDVQVGSRVTVLYPDPTGQLDLGLDLTPGNGRPGDPVTAHLTLATADGVPVRGVAGLVAVDTALEEMLAERGHPGARSHFRHSSEASFRVRDSDHAGWNRRNLSRLQGREEDLGPLTRLLLRWGPDARMVETSDHAYRSSRLYRGLAMKCLTGIRGSTDRCFEYGRGEGPEDLDELEQLLAKDGLSLATTLDPWDRPYVATIGPDGAHSTLAIWCRGSDGKAGTEDDIRALFRRWRWFENESVGFELAVKQYYTEHGRWPLDRATVIDALNSRGIDFEQLHDPWGHPLTIDLLPEGSILKIRVRSPGPDGRLESVWWTGDDAVAWSGAVDTFAALAGRIKDALVMHFAAGLGAPSDAAELRQMLAEAGIGEDELVDLYGVPFDLKPGMVPVYTTAMGTVAGHTEPVPVRSFQASIMVRSAGADGHFGTDDDRQVARLLVTLTADSGAEGTAGEEARDLDEHTGCIAGLVTDHEGIPLPGVTVTIVPEFAEWQRKSVTDHDGRFARNLPAGTYTLFFRLDGFGTCIMSSVAVEPRRVKRVTASLGMHDGYLGEITVTAEAPVIGTTVTAIASSIVEDEYGRGAMCEIAVVEEEDKPGRKPGEPEARERRFSTPRLRKDFPETLLWEPELLFGEDGSVSVDFDLADAVTTWNVQAVASTADGRLVTAGAPLVASLPFYVDLEHPQVLTVGDRIDLPVVVRNFTGSAQRVDLDLAADPALQVAGARQSVEVAAGEAEPVRFAVQAVGPDAETAVRATAFGDDASDAVERRLDIEPDGERQVETLTAALTDEAEFRFNMPPSAVPGSVQARLVVMPDFAAQLAATFEGVMRRPTGCAEQISSAAWLRVLRLRYYEKVGITEGPDVERDRLTLVEALARLGEIQRSDGGFPFWSGGKPRVELTAHVLRFALAAGQWVDVDNGMISGAAHWLAHQQTADGTWRSAWARRDESGDVQLTAAVIRALTESIGDNGFSAVQDAVTRGLNWLEPRLQRFPEPHALATFALACHDLGRADACRKARQLLSGQARAEGPLSFWALKANTPLGGWGLPGRLETTALAVQALSNGGEGFRQQVAGGTRFLLRHKDCFGVWYSTLGTISVLEALAAGNSGGGASGGVLEVLVGEEKRAEVELPTDRESLVPIHLDLGSGFDPGATPVRLVRSDGDSEVVADLVVSWYRPWPAEERRSDRAAEGNLSLAVTFDRHRLAVGEEVRCRVHAERLAYRGYGMLLAEVGLPPGAVVDRLALEKQLGRRFEIRPDRVILYLWPWAGGSDVELIFTPRFSGEVVTAPSQLYDYYNPESAVTLPPQRFRFERGESATSR